MVHTSPTTPGGATGLSAKPALTVPSTYGANLTTFAPPSKSMKRTMKPLMIRPVHKAAFEFMRLSIHHRKNIAVGVLEPRHLVLAGDVDVALSSCSGEIVMLELDAFRLQRVDDFLERVADHPRDGRRFVRAREL